MKFVSYAQNFEDVVLWRALRHVQSGFYVDLGAWSPDSDSVTRAFYERGWRGVNVEPNPVLHTELQAKRPRDVNLCVAVGAKPGKAMMNFVENSGLSTLSDGVAERHQAAGWGLTKREVRVVTLEEIFGAHIPESQEIHFLKIDVEGMEGEVIRGFPWMRIRPWILVVEATEPMTQKSSHETWEGSLTAAGYEAVYWDGLNRFYLAQEQAALRQRFSAPPNVFDDFELAHSVETRELQRQQESRLERISEALAKAVTLSNEQHQQIASLRCELDAQGARSRAFEARVRSLEASLSWRVTAPLRMLLGFCVDVKRRTAFGLRAVVVRSLRHARLVAVVHAVLGLVPPVHKWMLRRVDLLVQGRVRQFGAKPQRQNRVPDGVADAQRFSGAPICHLEGGASSVHVTVDEALTHLRAELLDMRRN